MTSETDSKATCARCGDPIDPADYFLISAETGDGEVAICRTEHIAAWVMRGAAWQLDRPWEVEAAAHSANGPLRLERHRSGEVVVRRFVSADELGQWAIAGGFWAER